jgi:COP9 signalosome complex subunit 6
MFGPTQNLCPVRLFSSSFTVAEHLIAQHNAIKMLHSRVLLVLKYIQAVDAGNLPRDHEILREAYSLCHRLPVLNTSRFKEEYFTVN